MKIFLGSSTESLESLRIIATWIEEFGFTPVPWDSPSLFIPGENTFAKLIEISKTHQAAIFLFADDDKIWYRQDTLMSQPRDNVLIEYGLFVGTVGQNKTIICKKGDTKIASDLNSIVFANLTQEHKARVQINAWMNKLKTLPDIDNQVFVKKIEKEINKRQVESLKQELDFERAKGKELQEIISKGAKIDFGKYDLDNDAHWKLLFDYNYFWSVVSAFCIKYKNLLSWRNEMNRQGLAPQIAWENLENDTWTKVGIAKTLRWFRKYSTNSSYQKFLSSIGDQDLIAEIKAIAANVIANLN